MSASQQINSNQQFNFYCLDQDPLTLAITRKPQIIKDRLTKQARYVWVYGKTHLINTQQQIQKRAQLKIHFFKQVHQVKQKFQKQDIILICHISLVYQVSKTLEVKFQIRIKCLILYGSNGQIAKEKLLHSNLVDFLMQVETEQIAIQLIKEDKYIYSKGQFVNFISLDEQVCKSNILGQTMWAMINQTTFSYKIIRDLVTLSKCYFPGYQPDADHFLKQYEKENRLSKKQAILWYQKQSFVYRIVNQILRGSKDPTCLYIIQPFFKDLFYAIYQVYTKQKNETRSFQGKSFKKFICYRGGKISQKQIKLFKENIGGIVQNLGFLSTSRDIRQVYKFVKNGIFQIQVQDAQRKPEIDYGFADISSYSKYYYDEEEILFNPLNTFRIISVVLDSEDRYIIKLKYGQMARIGAAQEQDLTYEWKKQKWIGEHQIRQRSRCCGIGVVLVQDRFNLEGGLQYCEKFIKWGNQIIKKINMKQLQDIL